MKKLLYVEIAEKIMTEVIRTNMQANTKVPSVREMALKYNVNPKTIQKAFEYLDDRGIFYSVVGEGRFLSADEGIIANIKEQLLEEEFIGFVTKMQAYDCDVEFVTAKIKEYYEREKIEGK